MSNLNKAKQRSIKRRRFIALLMIYFMILGVLSILIGQHIPGEAWVWAVVLGTATVAYWLTFYILIRRQKQMEKKDKVK